MKDLKKGKESNIRFMENRMKENMKDLPGGLGEAIPRMLTGLCFGDFYTRGGLDIKTRELMIFCV